MSSSSVFKWFFALALLLSIAWKIAVSSDNLNDAKDGLVEFFERDHFNVVVAQQTMDISILQANSASCRLQVARVSPDGRDRDLIRDLAKDADRLFFVFRGRVYTRQPIFWTVVDDFWSKRLRELGFIKHIIPVIAVAVYSPCDAENLPWNELSEGS